ncbi:SelB C-terminal domain-containing protein [Photobacterium leiognathi subsp. mandapamensis]
MTAQALYAHLPSVDLILNHQSQQALINQYGKEHITALVRQLLDQARDSIKQQQQLPLWLTLNECDGLALTQQKQQRIINTRGWLHLASHQLQLTEQEQHHWLHVAQMMQTSQEPWWVRDLANACDIDEDELRTLSYKLAQLGYISAIVKDRYVTHEYLIHIANAVRKHIEQNQKLETADFRNLSQLGRKVAVQILEYLDKIGFTKRKFNYRELRDEDLLKG